MRFLKYTIRFVVAAMILLVGPAACGERETEKDDSDVKAEVEEKREEVGRIPGKLVRPERNDLFTVGDIVEIELEFDEGAPPPVKFTLFVDGNEKEAELKSAQTLVWESGVTRTGNRRVRVRVEFENGAVEQYSTQVVFLSDQEPLSYTYSVLNTYPHDIRAFTQGLVYDGEYLYESTGQYGSSTLRRVELETGEVLQSISLERELFGEGLALLDGKLYQLTWKSGTGFIYDKETFSLLDRFSYPTEGWGLTTDGEYLYKTDGSHNVYILDPESFAEVDRLQVYDTGGEITELNEMEYHEGLIYANVFEKEKIVIFEKETGRVYGWIDLTGILDEEHHHPNLDVLNGIAYNPHNGTFFVTGKNWPLLFEIEIIPDR